MSYRKYSGLCLMLLFAPTAWADLRPVGSSGPVDRPVAWGQSFLNSDHIGGTISFIAPDSAVTLEFLSRGSIPIDGILLDGPGGLDGPTNEFDNRWFNIYLSGDQFLQYGYPVPNPQYANFGPDEHYLNFPDSSSVAGWTGAIWQAGGAPDSMGTNGYPTSYTGSIRVGEAATGKKYSSLRLGNLVPGSNYTLTYWSYFTSLQLGSEYNWTYPPGPEQELALAKKDNHSLWLNIYADDNQPGLEIRELRQMGSMNSGCPDSLYSDASRFCYQGDWLVVRGEPDPLQPGTCLNQDLKLWRRTGTDLVSQNGIPAPPAAVGQEFGASIAIDGDYLAVGSALADTTDPVGGSVFMYKLENGTWTLMQEIKAPATLTNNRGGFGHTVVLKHGLMGVWANAADELLIFELQNDFWNYTESVSGFVEYFQHPIDAWSLGDFLAVYVGADGPEFVVSSSEEFNESTGSPPEIGAAKVVRKVGAQWDILTEYNPMGEYPFRYWTEDHFAHAMDASALRQVYGIPNNDQGGPGAGAVWVRFRDSVAEPWSTTTLYPPRPVADAGFGSAVAIEGDVLLVGAPGAISAAGVTGICYRYTLDNGVWVPAGELLPTNVAAGDRFGTSLGLANGFAVVSAPGGNSGSGALYFFSAADCDGNGDMDGWEIQNGLQPDADNDGILDGCPGAAWRLGTAALFESFVSTKSMSWGDYDGDGDDDIYLATGSGEANRLLRNDQELGFVEVTPFMLRKIWSDCYSAAWGDCNLDGKLDLAVAADGEDFLFFGNGDGTFSIAPVPDLQVDDSSRGAGWGDIDGDGYLDLAIAHGDFDTTRVYQNATGLLGTFDLSGSVSLGQAQAVSWLPVQSGGEQDLVVGSVVSDMEVYGSGPGQFEVVVTPTTGLEALGSPGLPTSLVVADFNNDALMDVLVATDKVDLGGTGELVGAQSIGFRNPDGSFTYRATPALDFDATVYSALAFDWDNDGDQDIYLTIDDPGFANRLYVNDGAGYFTLADDAVIGHLGRSLCVTAHDAEGDGDLDLYLVQENGPNKVFENRLDNGRHWLRIRPVAQSVTVNAVGAQVELYYPGGKQVRMISGGGGSYLGQSPQTAHFGLGASTTIDSLKVRWPGGAGVRTVRGEDINLLGVDREIVVTEAGAVSAVGRDRLPRRLEISGVFPNPFNPATTIDYALPQAGPVSIRIHDLSGRLVRQLLSGEMPAGQHKIVWRGTSDGGSAVPSGVYFLSVTSGSHSVSRKITLLK